jgi:hypothetical protein
MWIDIQASGLGLSAQTRTFVERKLRQGFARFGNRIEQVSAHFADINGPRGGIDKRLIMRVRIGRGQETVVETRDADFYTLLDRTVQRGKRNVALLIQRATQARDRQRPAWAAPAELKFSQP